MGEKTHKKPIDENCATHIIRHALGGVSGGASKQYERLIDILQVDNHNVQPYINEFRFHREGLATTATTSP